MAIAPPVFTPMRVLGAPDRQWRIVAGPGRGTVQCRILPDGEWLTPDEATVQAEIAYQTETGQWLAHKLGSPAPRSGSAGPGPR